MADGVVRARGWLKGNVSLSSDFYSIVSSHRSIRSVALELVLVGEEILSVYASPSSRTCRRCCCVSERPGAQQKKNAIFFERKVLCDFASITLNNIFTYPFSIYLPGSLPPSTDIADLCDGSSRRGGSCSVQYHLTAKLVTSQYHPPDGETPSLADETTTTTTNNYYYDNTILTKETKPLRVIGEAPSTVKYPHVVSPTVVRWKRSHGLKMQEESATIEVRTDNTHISKGGYFTLSLAVYNYPYQSIDSVAVNILEIIHCMVDDIQSESQMSQRPCKIGPCTLPNALDKTIVLSSCSDALPNKHQNDEAAISPSGSANNDRNGEETEEWIKSDKMVRSFLIPIEARDSYQGELFNITHDVQIVLVEKENPFRNHVVCTIPIKIFAPPIISSFTRHALLMEDINIVLND